MARRRDYKPPHWLTITEAAYVCGVSRSTIYAAVQRHNRGGLGMPARLGRSRNTSVYRDLVWYVKVDDALAYIERIADRKRRSPDAATLQNARH